VTLERTAVRATMTLATASSTGVPHASTLPCTSCCSGVYVRVPSGSTPARHIEQNPIVSFVVELDDGTTLAGTGTASPVTVPEGEGVACFRIAPIDGRGDELERHRELVDAVFPELGPCGVVDVTARTRTVVVDAGEEIVRQDERDGTFFIIADGDVEILREDHGETRRLRTMTTGEFFGEMASLRDAPRSATVRALRATRLLVLGRDEFHDLVARCGSTRTDLDRLIHDRVYRLVAGV
jgi:hypothetical protein